MELRPVDLYEKLRNDPLALGRAFWPEVRFYKEQRDIIESVWHNDETMVPAGNMLGKDFVAGFIAVSYFITHHPCRIITTSVADHHLKVLWGEIGRFITTSRIPLTIQDGGPLLWNHYHIKKLYKQKLCDISYLIGKVCDKAEGMAGHHAAFTLAILDEASGIDTITYTQIDTWAKRKLIIGNPNACTNFFYHGVQAGDLKMKPKQSKTG